MKTIAYFPFLFLLLFLFSGCSKKTDSDPWQPCSYLSKDIDTIRNYMQGNWELVRLHCIDTNLREYFIPSENMDHKEYLVIKDSKISYRNSNSDQAKIYQFKLELFIPRCPGDYDDSPLLIIDDPNVDQNSSSRQIKACPNTLFIVNPDPANGVIDALYKKVGDIF